MSDPTTSSLDDAQTRRAAYLKAMRQVPGAVAVIACTDGASRGGLAATAWTSVSADPPIMLVCVNKSASAHSMFKSAGAFTINLLPTDDTETVAVFSGQRGLSGDARFLAASWRTGERGQPILPKACASFECSLLGSHDYGTHTVLIGQVEAVHSHAQSAGLIYVDGTYATAQSLR